MAALRPWSSLPDGRPQDLPLSVANLYPRDEQEHHHGWSGPRPVFWPDRMPAGSPAARLACPPGASGRSCRRVSSGCPIEWAGARGRSFGVSHLGANLRAVDRCPGRILFTSLALFLRLCHEGTTGPWWPTHPPIDGLWPPTEGLQREKVMHVRTTALALAAGLATLPILAAGAPAEDGGAVQLGRRPY